MTALVCLRCINTNTKDILMASNADDIGDFDDIVMLKESLEGSCIAYMVQLKHQDNPKDLKPADFISNLTKSKDFKLSKYSESFRILKNKLETFSPDESEIIKRFRKVDRIIFVLLTNKGVGDCKFLKKHQDDVLSFLNSSNLNSDLYCFDGAQLQDCSSEFLQSLFLLTKQTNVDGLDVLIKKEIERIINPVKLIDEDLNTVSKDFVTFIKTWVQSKLEDQYFLTKHDIINKLVSLILDCFKINLTDNLNEAINIDIFHDICCVYAITIVNWDEKVFQYLVQYLAGQLENYCGRNEPTVNRKKQEKKYWGATFKHWGNNLRPQLKDLLYRKHEDFKEHMFKIAGNPENLTFSDIHQYLWLTRQLPLLLEVNTLEEFQNIVRILELSQFTFHVILFNKTGRALPKTDSHLKRFETLQDLNETYKKNVSNQNINLQGRSLTLLRDVADDSMFQHLGSNDVINVLMGDFNIGNVYEAPLDYFIERSVYRILLKPTVLENIKNELFVIEMKPELVFDLAQPSKTIEIGDVSSSDLNRRNIIMAEAANDLKEEKIKILHESSRKTIHWLLYHGTNQLEWKKTFGSTSNIKWYQIEEGEVYYSQLTYTVDELFLLPNTTNILSASPGMGKSTLMDCLAHRAPKDVWILKVNLNQHETYYDSEECQNCETPASVHLNYFNSKFLEKCDCNIKLAEAVFQKMLNSKKVVVLLDGFDEISIFFKDEVTNIAKCLQREGFKVWITTRPIMKTYLEEELDSISTALKPFTVEDQEEFLEKYFAGLNVSKAATSENCQTMKQFIRELLDTAAINLNDRDREFMGIPLQIKLLAEAFHADYLTSIDTRIIQFNKSFDLLDLYENFVKTKTNILCAKHGIKEKREFEKHKEYQYFSALKILFKSELLQKLNIDKTLQRCEEFLGVSFFQKGGIMVAKNEFVHRTYPEYLSAKWMAENLHHKGDNVRKAVRELLNERFNQQYKFLFNIFDRIICKGCDVHLLVINGQLGKTIETIESSVDGIVAEDMLGRSLLHIVALYGDFSPSQTFYEYLIKLNKDRKNNVMKLVKLILNSGRPSIKDDKLGYSPVDYAIANGSLETANIICAHSNHVTIKVLITQELRPKYFLYCAKMNYEYLFKTLLRYFSYITLVGGNVEQPLWEKLNKYCIECCEKLLPQVNDEVLEKLRGYIKTFDGEDLVCVHRCLTEPDSEQSNLVYNDLHIATAFSFWYNVELLSMRGIEIDKQDIFLRTPLHYAVLFNKPDIITLLLQKGAQINASDKEGNTPLHYAVKENLIDITNILLEKDAKLNIENRDNKTALQLAMESNGKDLKQLFLEKGFTEETTTPSIPWEGVNRDIVVEDKIIDVLINHAFQQTPHLNENDTVSSSNNKLSYHSNLHEAVLEGDLVMIENIISSTEDINAQNYIGDTALHWAVRQKNVEIVELLLSHNADVNIPNSVGDTPLHCSLREDCDDVTLLLLSYEEEKQNVKNKLSGTLFNSNKTMGNINKDRSDDTTANRTVTVNKTNINKENPLILATQRGKVNIVELLINVGVDINASDGMGNTALHYAAMNGLKNIVSELLTAGAEINEQNRNRNTSLHLAISKGHTDVVKLLLTNGADVTIAGDFGSTVLHNAAKFGSPDTISLLLNASAGIEVNKQSSSRETPLQVAAKNGNSDATRILLAWGADVKVLDRQRNTVLDLALRSGSQGTVLALLDAGVEVNQQNAKDDNTPLHVAALENRLEIVKALLAKGADVNIAGSKNNTALHNAAEFGLQEMIATLLDAGIEIDSQNAYSETPLLCAVLKNRLESVKCLLAKGADFNILDLEGNTALHNAAMYSLPDIISELLCAGADINGQNAQNRTALHLAVSIGRLDIVMLLLTNGANVNIHDNSKDTALHTAAGFDSKNIFSTLLTKTAELNRKETNRDTTSENFTDEWEVFQNAINFKLHRDTGSAVMQTFGEQISQNLVLALLNAGAEINKQNVNNRTPLHLAASKGYINRVKLLLANGADVSTIDSDGNTALHIAASLGFPAMVSALLDAGDQINRQNSDGDTPLHLATLKGFLDTVELLLTRGADVNILGCLDNTALHNAVLSSVSSITALLLHAGAGIEIDTRNAVNDTPLHVAVRINQSDGVKILLANGADVNIPDGNGNTAVQIARKMGLQDLILELCNSTVNNN